MQEMAHFLCCPFSHAKLLHILEVFLDFHCLFGSRNSPTTGILHTIRRVYRSVWPAREAKPHFGAVLWLWNSLIVWYTTVKIQIGWHIIYFRGKEGWKFLNINIHSCSVNKRKKERYLTQGQCPHLSLTKDLDLILPTCHKENLWMMLR